MLTKRNQEIKIQKFLYDLSQLSLQDLNLEQFLKRIHVGIKSLMSARNFYIALYDKKRDMYSFPYHVDQYDDIEPDEFESLKNTLTDHVRKTKKAEIITAEREKEIFSNKFNLVGEYSNVWIGAPILIPQAKKVMGVIALQDYEREDVYSENELKILEIIASNIGLFIERINNLSKLKMANAAKDKFFSIVAHDLRNPFQQLRSISELLLEDLEEGRMEDVYELAKLINSSANKGFNLLQDLLKWSRAQMDSLEHNPEKFEVNSLLKEISSQFETHSRQKEIKLTMQSSDELHVFADKEMVKFVVRNILANSFKFTKRGGSIGIKSMLQGDKVIIEISDTGIGMDKEQLKSLFIISEKKSRKGTEKEEGTGFALVVCKEFVEKNNGSINVTSTTDVGTTFKLTFPTKSKTSNKLSRKAK